MMADEPDGYYLPAGVAIAAEILEFPNKEFYPGFFDDFRLAKQLLRDRLAMALATKAARLTGTATDPLKERAMDTALKVQLVLEHQRNLLRADNDNNPNDPSQAT